MSVSHNNNNDGKDTRGGGGGGGGFHLSSFLKGVVVASLAVILLANIASSGLQAEQSQPEQRRDLEQQQPHQQQEQQQQQRAVVVADEEEEEEPKPLPLPPPMPDAAGGPVCLGLGDGEELDRMLSRYDLVYVLTHAKSGSSTVKFFAKECTGLQQVSANDLYVSKNTQDFLRREFRVPPFLSGRMVSDNMLVRLLRNSITNSLVIYVHREDTERFKSGIRQVASGRYFKNKQIIDEDDMFKIVAKKQGEIGLTGNKILTCKVYESIDENQSDVVFLNIDRLDGLLRLLKKHHCPGYNDRGHINPGENKEPRKVRLSGDEGRLVDLDDWIDAKGYLLEHAYYLKSENSCQGTTKLMEQKLFACPDQTYWFSSLQFPLPS